MSSASVTHDMIESHGSTRPTLVPPQSTGSAVVHDLTVDLDDKRDLRLVAGQRQRLDTRSRELGRLLERRPELRGAHAAADLALDGLFAGI